MSTTIFNDCKTAALRRPDSTVVYVLFEQACESNGVPHRMRWAARTIGTYDAVLAYVMALAAACEDGSRQTLEGCVTPEAHLLRWQRALRLPVALPDATICLAFGTERDGAIPTSRACDVLDALYGVGRADLADELRARREPVALSLHRDVDVLMALYGDMDLGLWRVLPADLPEPVLCTDLAPAERTAVVALPEIAAFALAHGHVLTRVGSEPFVHHGSWYFTLEDFILRAAYRLELASTGAARDAIPLFRSACLNAPSLPASTLVTVSWAGEDGTCEAAVRLASDVPHGVLDVANGTFAFEFGDVPAAASRELLGLPPRYVHWEVPPDAGGR